MVDVAVVGGGILGLATARELLHRRPGSRVVVLERESSLASHQTGRNSGVVHAGIYYVPGSLKARLCVEGARELWELCEARGIPHEQCGKLIIASDASELDGLAELERRGRANGVPGLVRIDGEDAIRAIEPHARGVAALSSPATGIADFGAVAMALADDVREAGGEIRVGASVESLTPRSRWLDVAVGGSDVVSARFVVACAGLWSDRLAVSAGASPDPRIVPFRGAYLRLRPERRDLVRSLIYPVPDPALPFLGVHLTKHTSGDVLIGPTALLSPARTAYDLKSFNARDAAATLSWPGTWRMAAHWWKTGVVEMRHAASRRAFVEAARRYVPDLSLDDIEPGERAGIRAQALARDGKLVDDFVFSRTERALHIRNAPSPGATSSLAIARMIADEAERGLA